MISNIKVWNYKKGKRESKNSNFQLLILHTRTEAIENEGLHDKVKENSFFFSRFYCKGMFYWENYRLLYNMN